MSFGKRGCHWPHKHFKATALRLAQVGFYYDSKDLYNDEVTCYICKCSYHGWKKDDIPMEIHKKTSPQCPLVIILDYSREWVKNPTEDQTYEPISSQLLKSRIETYGNWWPHTYPNITPEIMAEAGFHFAPDIELEDKVECAYCKAKFGNWTQNDNPRNKHFRFNEKCPFFCVTKLKRRRLKKKEKESKKDNDLIGNSSNEKNKNNKGKDDMEVDDSNKENNDNSNKKNDNDSNKDNNDDNDNRGEIKKTYKTRYAIREIKKVDYVEKDSDDELFYATTTDEDEEEEGEEEGKDESDDDEYVNEMGDDSILKNNTEENEPMDNKENKQSEAEIEVVEVVKAKRRNTNNYDKEGDNDEYVNSSDSDFSSSAYEEMLKKKEYSRKKKHRRKYKRRKKPVAINDLDESMFVDDELDSEEEELRNKEIKRLFSTDNYLGPLPKIKSKNVIEEEKKIYEEMVKQAEENSSESKYDIKNTNSEFVSVTSILKKRKKDNSNDGLNLNPKRVLLDGKKSSTSSFEHVSGVNIENKGIDYVNTITCDNNEDDKNKSNDKDNLIKENSDIKNNNNQIDQYTLKDIIIQIIKKEKNFNIVKVLSTNNHSTRENKNFLEFVPKQQIKDILKDTAIKLIEKNNDNIEPIPLNFSNEDLNKKNIFMKTLITIA
jgi:hypothetical protein